MWKKISSKLPLIIPVILAGVLMVEMLGVRLLEMKDDRSLFDVTDKMQRTATIEELNNPIDLVDYILQSYKDQDLDRFMRGTAIEEMAKGIDVGMLLEKNESYMNGGFALPSGKWEEYAPLTAAVLADKSSKMFQQMNNKFSNPDQMKIVDIQYIDPVIQLSEDNMLEKHTVIDCWGADIDSQIIALIDYEDQFYMVLFSTVAYEHNWKLFIEDQLPIYKTSKEQYDRTKSKDQETVAWYENYYQISETQGINEDTMLPLNYYLVNTPENRNCSKIIDRYFDSINKSNYCKTIACFNVQGKTTEERLQKQAQASEQIQEDLAQTMDLKYRTGKTMLNEVGRFPAILINELNPEGLKHLSCESYSITDSSNQLEKNAVVSTKYIGYGRTMGITFTDTGNGWLIEQLNGNTEE